MNAVSLYNRLIYRDLLGYGLPGSILVMTMIISSFPHEIYTKPINVFNIFSTSYLITTLIAGFCVGQIVAVLPRLIFRSKWSRKRKAKKVFSDYRVTPMETIISKAFNSIFGRGSWKKFDDQTKQDLIHRWINTKNLYRDDYFRIRSLRIFFENLVLILPLSTSILVLNNHLSSVLMLNSNIHIITIGAFFTILAIVGKFTLDRIEARETIYIFLEDYLGEQFQTKQNKTRNVDKQ